MWSHSSFIAGITEHFTADYKVTHAGNDMNCQAEVKLQAGFWAHPEDEKNSGRSEWHRKHQTCPPSCWPTKVSLRYPQRMFAVPLDTKWAPVTQCAPNTPFQISLWSDLCLRGTGAPAPILQVSIHTRGMMNCKSLSLLRPESFTLLHRVRVVLRSWKTSATGPLF